MYLFFDTETTGVPKNYKGDIRDFDNWPRIIQLAYAYYTNDGELVSTACELIKPDGWEIPNEKFWIDNGFDTETSIENGVPIKTALENFVKLINGTNMMVAHNLAFDLPIVQSEMLRAEVKAISRPQKFCTMQASTDICKIQGPYGFKWPKLEELHNYLFGVGFDGAHDALNDVMATAKCFFELKKQEFIQVD